MPRDPERTGIHRNWPPPATVREPVEKCACALNLGMMTDAHVLPARPADPTPFWRLLSPATLLLTAAASLLGMATAAACGCGFDARLALATLVLAIAAHGATNLLAGHVEVPGTDPDAAILAQARPWARMLLGLLPLAGLWLAARSGGGLVWLGAAGLLLIAAYLVPPLQLGRRGGSELVALATWWLVVIGADYAQRRQLFPIPAALGLGVGLLAACVPLASGLAHDTGTAGAPGRRTLAERLGPRTAALLYAWLVLLAHGWLVLSVWLLIPPRAALWGLVSLPLSLAAAGLLWQRKHPMARHTAVRLSLAAAVLHPLALAAALAQAALQR